MKPFALAELKTIILILIAIIALILINLKFSLIKTRDAQRKDDIRLITSGLAKYHERFGQFPFSNSKGEIVACLNKENAGEPMACIWGEDALKNIYEAETPFIERLPIDPGHQKGISYFYLSDGLFFQVFGALEGKDREPEYSLGIEQRNVACGIYKCNFGRSSFEIPLDKSIEEYENELRSKGLLN